LQPGPSGQKFRIRPPEQEAPETNNHNIPLILDRLVVRKKYLDPDGDSTSGPEPEDPDEFRDHWEFDFGWPSDNRPKGQLREGRVRVVAVLGKPTEDPECKELLLKVFDWNRIEQVLKGHTAATDTESAPRKRRTKK
jgi:hypothetical protein